MSLFLNSKRATTAKVVIPYYGAWAADVVLAVPDTIPSSSTFEIGGLSLIGASYRTGSFTGSRSVRLVGGFGGWRKPVPAQGYQSSNGIKMSIVLGDAAAIVGEQVVVATDRTIGESFVREAAPAQRVLRQLAGDIWWIDTKGKTQVGPRASSAITSPFQVIAWSGSSGAFEIATETVSDWMPGRTFTSPTVTSSQTIGMTSIVSDNQGKLRVRVLSAPSSS